LKSRIHKSDRSPSESRSSARSLKRLRWGRNDSNSSEPTLTVQRPIEDDRAQSSAMSSQIALPDLATTNSKGPTGITETHIASSTFSASVAASTPGTQAAASQPQHTLQDDTIDIAALPGPPKWRMELAKALQTAYNIASKVLPVAQIVAEGVPIAGGPLKAVVGALLEVMKGLDVRTYYILFLFSPFTSTFSCFGSKRVKTSLML
jgi:hypothetical protein